LPEQVGSADLFFDSFEGYKALILYSRNCPEPSCENKSGEMWGVTRAAVAQGNLGERPVAGIFAKQ
jgi:hypothetical protein